MSPLSAQVDSFGLANKMASEERYISAVEVYEDIVKRGNVGVATLSNLGYCYAKMNRYPEAIWAYEKALQHGPNDVVLKDLKQVKGKVDNEIPQFSEFFLIRWWKSLNGMLPSSMWALMAMLFFTGFLWTSYQYWIKDNEKIKSWRWVTFSIFLILLILSFTSVKLEQTLRYAIVLEETAIFVGSDERSDKIRDVGEGNKVRLLDAIGGWNKVELPDKEIGWMDGSFVREL